MPDIKTGENRANSAARKFHNSRDMGRRIDRDFRAIFRLAGHSEFRKGRLHRGGHNPDWTHHSGERGEKKKAYVKQGASAGFKEEIGGGMPEVPSVVQPECRRSKRGSD